MPIMSILSGWLHPPPMQPFGEWFLEKLAGHGPGDRLTKARFEKQYLAALVKIENDREQAVVDAKAAKKEAKRIKKRNKQRGIARVAKKERDKKEKLELEPKLARQKRLDHCRRPSAVLNEAWGIPNDPDKVYPWPHPHIDLSKSAPHMYMYPWDGLMGKEIEEGEPIVKIRTFRSGFDPEPDHVPTLERTGRPRPEYHECLNPKPRKLKYPVPEIGPMEGCGAYRRSCNATEEWKLKKYNEYAARTELWPTDGSNQQPTMPGGPIFLSTGPTPELAISGSTMTDADHLPETPKVIITGFGSLGSYEALKKFEALPGQVSKHCSSCLQMPPIPLKELEYIVERNNSPKVPEYVSMNKPSGIALAVMEARAKLKEGEVLDNGVPPPRRRRPSTKPAAPKILLGFSMNAENREEAIEDAEDDFIDDEDAEAEIRAAQERRMRLPPLNMTRKNDIVVPVGFKKRVEFRHGDTRCSVPGKSDPAPCVITNVQGNAARDPVTGKKRVRWDIKPKSPVSDHATSASIVIRFPKPAPLEIPDECSNPSWKPLIEPGSMKGGSLNRG
ncbi:MAG: hypothetical protein M4579_007090 [Chaenotheca gracillima]|nr:MAG: hypothetical protein M4579_007090 [Chaenotheca gracillima]